MNAGSELHPITHSQFGHDHEIMERRDMEYDRYMTFAAQAAARMYSIALTVMSQIVG